MILRFNSLSASANAGITTLTTRMRCAKPVGAAARKSWWPRWQRPPDFLAFTPTNFVGVAQLGIIAGVGMLIAFSPVRITFLPAMLCLCHPRGEAKEVGFAFARHLDPLARTWRWPLVAIFPNPSRCRRSCLAHTIKFDGDPLHTKDPHTEAIRTLYDLMQNPVTNPYTIEALLPSLQDAQLWPPTSWPSLHLTQEVLTLNSFLPEHQVEKLALIHDAASVLAATLSPPSAAPNVTPEALRTATVSLVRVPGQGAQPSIPRTIPMRLIAGDLQATCGMRSDATLLAANDSLTRFLPLQLSRLREALTAKPVTLADIPEDLRRDWVLPDGRARLQALPKAQVNGGRTLRRWVKAALKAVPQAAGSAVWILKSADTITSAFPDRCV